MATSFTSRTKGQNATKLTGIKGDEKILVIGNGMVGLHFCKSLIKRGLNKTHRIQVIGAEKEPAYDRIHLSEYVETKTADNLIFQPKNWYSENHIDLTLGEKVIKVDSDDKCVYTNKGDRHEYDILVFATGSRAFAPPIDGIDNSKVILYRTIEDVQKIVSLSEGKEHATIIGGGLLGLEAAQAVQKLQLSSTVIHLGGHLMPAQLNPAASTLLKNIVESQGIEVLLKGNTTQIKESHDRLTLTLDDDRTKETDLVIVSAGIRPNSEVAQEAGIKCGIRGGIVVDNHMATSVDGIFAIGECALFRGNIYGLAAPGYAMADHLVARLAGDKIAPMQKPDLSTKLKMVGVDVTTIGNALNDGVLIEYKSEDTYRAVTMTPKGDLVGALGVGDWPEANRIQSLYQEGAVISQKEKDLFIKEGILRDDTGEENSVQQWPDNRILCNCMGVTKGEIVDCFKTCGVDPDAIAKKTGASDVCGSCRPLLEELCNKPPSTPTKPVAIKRLLTLSIIALVGIAAILILPPAPIADSVESWYYKIDKLWRSNVVKQITGYAVMLVFLLGLLISLRKRFKWFRFGHFNRWRVFHALFGVISVITLFFHTGFHFGDNLNYWLMLCFVLINLLGGVAGIVSAIESSGTSELALKMRNYRPILVYLHIILFWPLPILLAFHIAAAYLY